MNQKISNQQEFNDNLKKLGDLYEEGKKLSSFLLPIPATHSDMKAWDRLREILKDMRDLAAIQMQRNHFIDEN